MNEKTPELNKSNATDLGATKWVMLFNVITGVGENTVKTTFKINKSRMVIGSALSCDIRIQQNAVSNLHAIVEMDDRGDVHFYDMASETGIFLNDKKVVSGDLRDGDELKIGFATLTFKKVLLQEAQAAVPAQSVKTSGEARKLFFDAKEDFRPLILEDERNVIQIFDYAKSDELALQIVMYWGDVILDVKHITKEDEITLGERKKSSFLVPDMATDFPLVSFEGGAAKLNLSNEMKGVVRTGKQLIPLKELGTKQFLLKKDDLAKVQIKDITFFVSYSPLPPHLRRQRVLERDLFYTRVWITSLALTAALVVLLSGLEAPKPLEVDEVPQRVATIIFKPTPPPPPVAIKRPEPPKPVEAKKEPEPKKEIPKELPKTVKNPPKTKPVEHAAKNEKKGAPRKNAGGDQGEGKRAAGPEGRKGAPGKPKAPIGQVQSRGNPNVKGAAKSDNTKGKGNVEALFDDISGTINQKLAASGKGASAAGERLRGYGGFTTEGNGGLGNVGTGAGGGGTSQTLSQGLGTKGLGEGATGNGLGAIGSGGNILGTGRGKPVIEVGNSNETVIRGGLDKSLIDEYIKRHMDQIRYCYVKEMNSSTKPISGRVATQFVISGAGRVTSAGLDSAGTTLANTNVQSCLLGVLKRIVFPEPLGGTIVEVSYPFTFSPSVGGN